MLCRLMRLHTGHVTLPGAEFQLSKLSPQAASPWALPQISILYFLSVVLYIFVVARLKLLSNSFIHVFIYLFESDYFGPYAIHTQK